MRDFLDLLWELGLILAIVIVGVICVILGGLYSTVKWVLEKTIGKTRMWRAYHLRRQQALKAVKMKLRREQNERLLDELNKEDEFYLTRYPEGIIGTDTCYHYLYFRGLVDDEKLVTRANLHRTLENPRLLSHANTVDLPLDFWERYRGQPILVWSACGIAGQGARETGECEYYIPIGSEAEASLRSQNVAIWGDAFASLDCLEAVRLKQLGIFNEIAIPPHDRIVRKSILHLVTAPPNKRVCRFSE